MGEARKPEEFDGLGEGKIWTLTDTDSDTRFDLYYRDGGLSLVAEVGGDGAVHTGELLLGPGTAGDLRDNLDAWIRWRGLKSRRRPEHLFCPVHGKEWQRTEVADAPSGVGSVKRYVCPSGDVWRTATGTASGWLLPWGEEV